jgi:hypothetical protein
MVAESSIVGLFWRVAETARGATISGTDAELIQLAEVVGEDEVWRDADAAMEFCQMCDDALEE